MTRARLMGKDNLASSAREAGAFSNLLFWKPNSILPDTHGRYLSASLGRVSVF